MKSAIPNLQLKSAHTTTESYLEPACKCALTPRDVCL